MRHVDENIHGVGGGICGLIRTMTDRWCLINPLRTASDRLAVMSSGLLDQVE